MLGCKGLTFAYPGAVASALADVTAEMGAGMVTGIAGPSGSGKSTLLRLLAGELVATSGTVVADGSVLAAGADAVRRREHRRLVGIAGQLPERQLFGKTVADDVAFGPRNLGLPDDDVQDRVAWALECVGLRIEEFGGRSPFALSGGEQRRVAIAGILALRPRYLLLDEPTAGLDPRGCAGLAGLVRRLADEGMGVAVVSHDVDLLTGLTDEAVLVADGRVVTQGPMSQVLGSAAAVRKAGLVPAAEVELAERLRQRGVDIPAGAVTASQLAACLAGESQESREAGEAGGAR